VPDRRQGLSLDLSHALATEPDHAGNFGQRGGLGTVLTDAEA
jgi:hypothetical protein